ncbi:MAG TPA: CheR family methyltransferase, partial [Chitinophagaceae bacterium]|nr:CheR family methyltransferase [Chitinophagaceae bacterium]
MPDTLNADNVLDGFTDTVVTVGIGASAGGIQAIKAFFEKVPVNTNIAYVVILHLSPNRDGKLAEVLRSFSRMPVVKVIQKVKVVPNHIYVIPPDRHLLMADGHIAVSPNLDSEDSRAPVDIFFRTLAASHGPAAICVVLSGTGGDGSTGLKRIKELGGAVFVQSPREAEYNEMPRNAISTGLVDAIMPVADIPSAILAYRNNLASFPAEMNTAAKPEENQNALLEIFTQLRLRTGHDFTNYKRPTLVRRIERRVMIKNLPNLTAYAGFLQQNAEEVHALLKDMLISVTNFFRDKKAFEAIQHDVLPRIIKDKNAEDQVRIWVAGCATGEEAYSIAMLCAEQTLNVIDAPKIQIFATDIDEPAITHARSGYYSINETADVTQERLRRFFNKEGDGYRVRREIREMVLFANHNFIKDPPFSHLDMISCRNVLIYLTRRAQERVMETFHFALNTGGYLFLGTSESIDASGNLYEVISRDEHIYKSRQVALRAYPLPDAVPVLHIDPANAAGHIISKPEIKQEHFTYGHLHQLLLEQYAPPSLVVNQEYDIVHLSERAVPYLQLAGGEPSQNLLKLIRPEMRLE